MFNRSDLLKKCELKPNMIVKALESRLVKPVVQHMRMEKDQEYGVPWLWKRVPFGT